MSEIDTKGLKAFISTMQKQSSKTPLKDLSNYIAQSQKKLSTSSVEFIHREYLKDLNEIQVQLLSEEVHKLEPKVIASELFQLIKLVTFTSFGPQVMIEVISIVQPDMFFLTLKNEEQSVAQKAFKEKLSSEVLIWVCLRQKYKIGKFTDLHPKCLEFYFAYFYDKEENKSIDNFIDLVLQRYFLIQSTIKE